MIIEKVKHRANDMKLNVDTVALEGLKAQYKLKDVKTTIWTKHLTPIREVFKQELVVDEKK